MTRHHETCVIEGCKKIPDGKLCSMHKSRWLRDRSYDDPRTIKVNNPNHAQETLKICKKHGNLEHKNIYFLPNSTNMFCKICQSASRKKRASDKKLKENYYEERKDLISFECNHCRETKPIDSFKKYWLSRKHPLCNDCQRKFGRKSLLKKNFNMTLEEYDNLLKLQNNKCAICFKSESVIHHSTKQLSSLCVDHNHTTNENRGLLCQVCNFGIGYFQDSADLLRNAALYLDKYA